MGAHLAAIAPRGRRSVATARSLPVIVVAASVVVALQLLGRTAGSGSLSWMLAPTAALAEWFSGVPFTASARGEYLNLEHGIVIARSCAGVRFFTTAFLLGTLVTLHFIDCSRKRWAVLAGALGGAYLTAVLANASRIAGAILLLRLDAGWGGLAKAGLHLAEGIVVFVSYLVLYFLIVCFAARRSRR